MNYFLWFQKFGKAFLGFLGFLLIFTFIITLFHYFNFLPTSVITVMKLIIPIVSFFIGGFLISKNSREKGWLEGLKCGGLFLVFMLLFSFLILKKSFMVTDLIYYLILLVGSVFGGMVGINFTTKEK